MEMSKTPQTGSGDPATDETEGGQTEKRTHKHRHSIGAVSGVEFFCKSILP